MRLDNAVMKENNVIADKSFQFAVRIVKLHKYLSEERREFVLSKQLLRSGTSIGANVHEGLQAMSKREFALKLSISLKEAQETEYWIRLLYETGTLAENEYQSIYPQVIEIIKILTSILKTSRFKEDL